MNEKLKIAMIGHKRIPSREGGVEIVVEELSTRMVESGYQVICYNRKGHHVSGAEFDSATLSEYKGIKLQSVWTLDRKGLSALTSSLSAAIKAAFGKYDVVHFHAEGPCAVLWIPKLFGKRCIATIHGIDWQRAKWSGLASKYIKFGEKVAAKYADEVIVLSKNVQKYFQLNYQRQTQFIPNGVNRPIRRNVEEIYDKYGLRKDSYILFLGRIVPEKGIQYLIEAFKKVKTDKYLVIAGGSSDTQEFLNEIRNMAKDDERILFTGFVEGNTLDELYSNAYIYTLPSDLEGMPLSLLEAMSYGNCCLTSDISECKEVIEDKAILFKKSDVSDLQDKLQYLCDHPDIIEHYKSESTDFICNKYNWDDVVNKTMKLYKEK